MEFTQNILHYQPYNKKHFVHIEYKQYISSIVTTLETFFRDTCFFLLVQNEQMIGELCEFYKLENADTHNLSINDQANYLSACFNFQNFKEIDELFSKILGINFWDNLGTSLFRNCSFENILLEKISLNQLIPSWKNSLEELLFIRNEIIHNANFRLTVNSKFITPAELTVLLVPQFTTLLVAQKYSLKNFKLNYEGKQYNFLFSIKDLIHSNWQIAEESTSSISLD